MLRPPPPCTAGMLQDRQQAQGLARLLDPLVRAADSVVGEKVAMLVEVEYEGVWQCSVQGCVEFAARAV